MSKTILSEVDGWTPLIDMMTKEYGLVTSAVFGRMWRFCQGDQGVCNASLERIASDLHLSRRTVIRHVQILCDAGYLADKTPDLRHKPHVYADTGKAGIRINIGVTESHTRSDRESHLGVTESPVRCDRESLKDTIKRQVKDTKEETFNPPSAEQPSPEDKYRERVKAAMQRGVIKDAEIKQTIHDLFHVTPNWKWKGNQAFLDWAKERKDGELEKFSEWWYQEDWRGQGGQPPTLAQIQELFPQAFVVAPVHESPLEKRIREKRERQAKYGR